MIECIDWVLTDISLSVIRVEMEATRRSWVNHPAPAVVASRPRRCWGGDLKLLQRLDTGQPPAETETGLKRRPVSRLKELRTNPVTRRGHRGINGACG
jgi:hypothetical protein